MSDVALLYFPVYAILVDSMSWSNADRAFVLETYFMNADSVIQNQQLFCKHFGVSRHVKVPERKTVSLWLAIFWETGICLKRKSPYRPRHFRSLRYVERLIENQEKHLVISFRKQSLEIN